MQLPKLLAKENITIQHGNYKTAWFDIKNRVLGLPMWEDMGKDVYDLLIGHEVGHALETPFEGWHDSPEKLEGCPRSYINVVEDARIERKVKDRYPGLVGPFSRGYKKLFDQEFFGDLTDVDWDQIKLIDKINLKAKIGNLLDVPFNAAEKVFYDRAMSTDDFAEVLQLVKDILAYTKENQEDLMTPPQMEDVDQPESEDSQNDDPTSGGHDDLESDNQNNDENTSNTKENGDGEAIEEEEFDSTIASPEPKHDEDVSVTDQVFRSKEKDLVQAPDGSQPTVAKDISKDFMDKIVVEYKDLKASREAKLEKEDNSYIESMVSEAREAFPGAIKEIKKNIQFAVKEFEQRKAATQWQKSSVSKTGNLDVNKLWSYKTNDDIFLRTTKLADSQNHGMMMVIDFSGSMSGSMKYVMDQVLHTVMFCKAVNIPFDVYGFTSTNRKLDACWTQYRDGDVELDSLSMPQICSSSLNKKDFEDALFYMYIRIAKSWEADYVLAPEEGWGSTPLNQALIVSHSLIKKFRAKHNIEKMNFLTFTDGDANSMRVVQDPKLEENKFDTNYSSIKLFVDGKSIESNTRRGITGALLNNIRKRYGVNTVGFFMADDNYHWNNKLGTICHEMGYDWYDYKPETAKEYRKNKCVEVKGFGGYDTFYLVKGNKNLDTTADDFDPNEDATKGQIGTAFKKYSKSKKLNKVLMTKFGAAVA